MTIISRSSWSISPNMGLQPWAKPSRFLSAPGRGRSRREGRRLLPNDLFEAILPRLHVFAVELEIVDGGPGQLFGGIDVHLLENGRPAVDDDLGTDSAAHLLYGDRPLGGGHDSHLVSVHRRVWFNFEAIGHLLLDPPEIRPLAVLGEHDP